MQQVSISSKIAKANHYTPVLIVARPDRKRDSVRAMLKAIPQLKIIEQADDGPAALKKIANHRPALVLLDSNLPENKVWSVLKQIKAEWPQTLCLILIDTSDQRPMAETAGADGVLVAEFSITKLGATIDKLLSYSE